MIYLMLRQACPDALGRGDTLHQLQSLRQAFQAHHRNPTDEQFPLDIYNQDLSGFFTSISTDRFLASLHLMTHGYKNKSVRHAIMPQLSPALIMSPTPPCGYTEDALAFKSQDATPSTSTTYPTLVLLLNYCMVGNTLLQQTRGAPMGSPASPALCDMVVAVCEQSWTHTFRNITYNLKHCDTKQFTLSGFFATRYVDNRLTLLPTCAIHLPHFSQFLSSHFYGAPIFFGNRGRVRFPRLCHRPLPTCHSLQSHIQPHRHTITTISITRHCATQQLQSPVPFWHNVWPHPKKQLPAPWSSCLRFIKPPATTKAGPSICANNQHAFAVIQLCQRSLFIMHLPATVMLCSRFLSSH